MFAGLPAKSSCRAFDARSKQRRENVPAKETAAIHAPMLRASPGCSPIAPNEHRSKDRWQAQCAMETRIMNARLEGGRPTP
jgi:hypothetical protein